MTVPAGSAAQPWSVHPLLAELVDDTSLLQPRMVAPGVDTVVARFLAARDGEHGGLVGQLMCPVSRLPFLVAELARAAPSRPVDLALVVDTGLGAVPKALSTVLSRPRLLTPRAVETSAPPDVDSVWLERVAEFVPEDVSPVVEPRRPLEGTPEEVDAWLDAVRRVAEHGCAPKLRCGGPRPSDVPSVAEVERFLRVAVEEGCGFTALGLRRLVREDPGERGEPVTQHGVLNLLVAVARALAAADVTGALRSTDVEALVRETEQLSARAVHGVRGLLSRCGVDAEPVTALAGLGLLA